MAYCTNFFYPKEITTDYTESLLGMNLVQYAIYRNFIVHLELTITKPFVDRDSEALAVLVLSKMLLFLGLRHLLILLISSYKLRLAQLRLSEHSLLAHACCWRALAVGAR